MGWSWGTLRHLLIMHSQISLDKTGKPIPACNGLALCVKLSEVQSLLLYALRLACECGRIQAGYSS